MRSQMRAAGLAISFILIFMGDLYMRKKITCFLILIFLAVLVQAPLRVQAEAADMRQRIYKVRVVWEAVPDAVMYQLVVTKGKSMKKSDIVTVKDEIYATGYELDTYLFAVKGDDLHWSVRAMNIHNQPMSEFTAPEPLAAAEINPQKPLPTTQFDRLPFAKLYPVYSWVPYLKASEYELQVFYDSDNDPRTADRLLKTEFVLGKNAFDFYDDDPYVKEGTYWWRVRAKNAAFQPISQWSEPRRFSVTHQGIDIAAFGDSITHGGGAVSTPPSNVMYDWETYAGVPILNLGLSGNTIEAMEARFERDVLPFRPKILVIFGGINNIRAGDRAEQVIAGLNRLKFKALINRIKPVFVTIAPINPKAMREVSGIYASPGWAQEQAKINDWVRRQSYHVDITPKLTDGQGFLHSRLSTDGLHPDVEGKKIIGEAIGQYLEDTFKNSTLAHHYKDKKP